MEEGISSSSLVAKSLGYHAKCSVSWTALGSRKWLLASGWICLFWGRVGAERRQKQRCYCWLVGAMEKEGRRGNRGLST